MMTWHVQLGLVPAVACLVAASCYGKSDDCSDNPDPLRRFNPLNFHPATCNLKWTHGCTYVNEYGTLEQKPPPFSLCDTMHQPAGLIPVDGYNLAVQRNDFAPGSPPFTLHGLWPSSAGGSGERNQPYGCLNGQEFDEGILTTLGGLLSYFWPTDPRYNNTMQCFILSEWMKHGTCAVIPGADGNAFRIPEEAYFRTAFVFAAEYNANAAFREQLQGLEPLISVSCVQCAYLATVGWTGTDPASVPRMSPDCVGQCFACGDSWDICAPAQLDSTVPLNPGNAPSLDESDGNSGFITAMVTSDNTSPWQGTWRSFGAEQLGSGKFEFAQTFTGDVLTTTTDSPYPENCTYEQRGPGEMVLHCGPQHKLQDCLVQRLPDIDGLDAAFLACNHTGAPAPASFYAAMDTPGCGNFLMFRCKASAAGCVFSPDAISTAGSNNTASEPLTKTETETDETETQSTSKPYPSVSHYQPGIAGAPPELLGRWRSLEVSSHYQQGLAQWNFTSDGQASLRWPNYPGRGVQRYSVSHAPEDPSRVLLASANGTITACRFRFRYQPVYSYAVLDCGAPDQPAGEDKALGNTKWAMGRCNPCSPSCRYSCGPENDFCGAGSCDPGDSAAASATPPRNDTCTSSGLKTGNDWCTPEDSSCWPTEEDINKLEQALDPTVPRLGLRWSSYPQPQPAPVPMGSANNQSFYGLGDTPAGLRALYRYENLDDMQKPCFSQDAGAAAWNAASDVCKAAVHQNEYRNWNPFIVVFPLNERHVAAALTFAARHRLCIATAGAGHEYNSRNSCPTGGLLIRTILLKDKAFLPVWREDAALAPAGAFRFGAGAVFAEMHAFSAQYARVISSGWCSTVGMVGFHLGGGHGPFAPSMGLGVDNVLEIEVLQIGRDASGHPFVHKKTASRIRNPELFWAMRGGGGGVWGVVLSMTLRAHPVPDGGLSHVLITQNGTFCPDDRPFGYEWLRGMWTRFAAWELMLNHKVGTQPGFFIDTSQYNNATGDLCAVTWTFNFEYFYTGSQTEPDYILFRDRLRDDVLQVPTNPAAQVQERNFHSAYEYVLTMPPNKFTLTVTNPLPPPHHPPSDAATGSQNSVLVSRHAMESSFPATMMSVLDICVSTLHHPDPTSPDPTGRRCGFHYLYTSLTGNLGSPRPPAGLGGTAISPGMRQGLMLWNARTLTARQARDTVYKIGEYSYFSESAYVLHNWTGRYWDRGTYEALLGVKRAGDPGNYFWCHHCVGDDPGDVYGVPVGAAPGLGVLERRRAGGG